MAQKEVSVIEIYDCDRKEILSQKGVSVTEGSFISLKVVFVIKIRFGQRKVILSQKEVNVTKKSFYHRKKFLFLSQKNSPT